jgi:hypothetical protein
VQTVKTVLSDWLNLIGITNNGGGGKPPHNYVQTAETDTRMQRPD